MKSPAAFRRITWAIDPFAEDLELQRRTAETVCVLNRDSGIAIDPVSVVRSYDQFVLSTPPISNAEVQRQAAKKVGNMIQSFEVPHCLPPTILVQNDLSISKSVRNLVEHAKNSGSDLIVLGSHTRSGVARFLLGSFAESLVLTSDVPVLIVSPHMKPVHGFKNIVYATDFSENSKRAFRSVVALAVDLGCKITLFHQTPLVSTVSDTNARQADEWIAEAQSHEVKVGVVFHASKASVRESVCALTEKLEAPLIAMVSQSEKIDAVLLGSITRQVIRGAECPVWVIHPKSSLK